MQPQSPQSIRLNKFLAERLGISRRQADELILSNKIQIERAENEPTSKSDTTRSDQKRTISSGTIGELARETAVIGARIDKNDKVWYNGSIIPFEMGYTYIAFNKPVGYVCSKRRQGDTPTIFEALPEKLQSLKTVGRLDKDSSGLILLTNDGDFAYQMTHPKFVKEKVYEVELDRALEPLHQQMIADFGVDLPDGKSRLGLSKMDDVSDESDLADSMGPINSMTMSSPNDRKKWRVSMSEGRNRQIRRTFAALGYQVKKLHRTQFGKYQLSGLKPSEFVEVKKI